MNLYPTKRETQILERLCNGLTAQEIATDLFISPYTVETHRRKLVMKLEARNTLHMVVKAIRMGMVCAVLMIAQTIFSQGNGSIIWEKNYGGSSSDRLTDFFEVSDGGFLIIANSRSDDFDTNNISNCSSFSGQNNFIVKLTSSLGQISWKKVIGGSGYDEVLTGIEVFDGYLIGGSTFSDDCDLFNEDDNTMLYKLNDNGDLVWIYTYPPHPNADNSFKVIDIEKNENESEFLVLSDSDNYTFKEVWLFTVNDQGIKTNSFDHLFSFGYKAQGLRKDSEGNYILFGTKDGDECKDADFQSTNDIWIVKISPTYQILWEKTFGSEDRDYRIADLEVVGTEINFIYSNTECFIATFHEWDKDDLKSNELPVGKYFARLDGNGNLVYSNEIEFEYSSAPLDLFPTSSGGWLLTTSRSDLDKCINRFCTDPRIICSVLPKVEPLYYVIKTSYDFDVECYTSFGGGHTDEPVRIIEETGGNFLVAGDTRSQDGDITSKYNGDSNYDCWIVESSPFVHEDPLCKVSGFTFVNTENDGIGPLFWANFINEFHFGDYSNVSDSDYGYGDYTGDEVLAEPGSEVSFMMSNLPTSSIQSTGYPANKFAIWIDWNQDGDFDDVDEEKIYNVSNGTVSGVLNIPNTVSLGDDFHMRIGTFTPDLYNENQNLILAEYVPNPCYSCFFGEYEDYTLTIELIPELECEFGLQTLVCDYLIFSYDYPLGNLDTRVDSYEGCSDPNKLLDGEEFLYEFYPSEGTTEVTIDLINLGIGDVDLIILDRCNEKTGIVACSQNPAASDETVTFNIDPSVEFYWVIVDGPQGVNTQFTLQVDCDRNFDCFGGSFSSQYELFHMNIEGECYDLAYNESISFLSGETFEYEIQLSEFQFGVPPTMPPAKTKLHMWIDRNDNGIYDQIDELWVNQNVDLDDFSFGTGQITVPNLASGDYKILLQIITLVNSEIEPIVDPCLGWFDGGHWQEYQLTILDSNPDYCNSVGCTYCPASGGDRAYINHIIWDNWQIETGDNGGYMDNTSTYLEMVAGNHPEFQIINFGDCLEPEVWRVWIDANQDNDFNDQFEKVIDQTSSNVFANNVFINALNPGIYRIRMQFETDNSNSPSISPDPCESGFIGETEDYFLFVCEGPSNCVAPPGGYDIIVNKNPIYVGDTVNYGTVFGVLNSFRSQSSRLKTGLDFSWTFPGGNPSNSADSEPHVFYDSPGIYDVQLEISTIGGTQVIQKNEFMQVYENSLVSIDDCPEDNMLSNAFSGTYQAASEIKISGTILSGSNVILKAGNNIQFENNFENQNGGVLEAIIENCNN